MGSSCWRSPFFIEFARPDQRALEDSRTTLLGTPYHIENYPANARQALEDSVQALAVSDPTYEGVKSRHAAAKAPQEWTNLVKELGRLWTTQPTFSKAEIGLIDDPVLIVKTDHYFLIRAAVFDCMAKQIHIAEVFHLPEGEHSAYRKKAEEVSAAIRAFLQAADVAK